MGQTEDTTNASFLDIFELDHTKYDSDENNTAEMEEEVVIEGHGEAENAIKEEDDDDADYGVADEEDESLEEEGSGKQAEMEDESEEDAPDHNDSDQEITPIQEMMENFAGSGILEFDEDSEYEPSEEGLKNLIKETVEKKSQYAIDNFKQNLPEQATQLLDILERGGSIEDYQAMQSEVDFSRVDISSERNQGYLIEDWMKLQGFEDLEIRDRIDSFKEAGILQKEASLAQKKLHENKVHSDKQMLQKIEADKKAYDERMEQESLEFKETVTNLREIRGFSVTEAKAKKLYEFITKPNREGVTKFQEMDSEENRLLYAMFAMDGFDKSKLSDQVASKQAIRLRKKLNSYQDKNVNPRGRQNKKSSGGGIDIPWSF